MKWASTDDDLPSLEMVLLWVNQSPAWWRFIELMPGRVALAIHHHSIPSEGDILALKRAVERSAVNLASGRGYIWPVAGQSNPEIPMYSICGFVRFQ
jgi:hypothetical protein